MASPVLGRTNESFPAKWLRLVVPNRSADTTSLIEAALRANTVIDVSASPALWGGHMRGTTATLMTVGPADLSRTHNEQSAHDSLHAHLIETLSSIGREHIDFYFLRVAGSLAESQISGALIALEEARQEGNIRFSGIAALNVFAAQSLLHFHDAFEAILLPGAAPSTRPLELLAKSRRLAVISHASEPSFQPGEGEAALYNVSSAAEIEAVYGAQAATR